MLVLFGAQWQLPIKLGCSCFPSLISCASCLSTCFAPQNIFYQELDPDELQWFLERVSCFLLSHSTQSTWSSILSIWLQAFWRWMNLKCKSCTRLLLCYYKLGVKLSSCASLSYGRSYGEGKKKYVVSKQGIKGYPGSRGLGGDWGRGSYPPNIRRNWTDQG